MIGIKDIVHKHISIPPYIIDIIDTPIFQRLGRIKQLTSAEYVFPGARHSRKEHCIGAMYLASKYSKSLGLSEDQTKSISVAALLHDVAHGPFSHSWDTIVYNKIYPGIHKGHDKQRHKIIKTSLLSGVLRDNGIDIEAISGIWNNNDLLLSAILQGPLGTDRMDFVTRDTLYTGTRHFGYMEIDRIINGASVYTKPDGIQVLTYAEKIVPDAIQGLHSRLYMYNKVYLHKTVIAASILIEAALQEASQILDFVERSTDLDKFVYLNDSVLDQIINSSDPDLKKAKYYAERVYHRDLPKVISEEVIHLSPDVDISHVPGIKIDNDKNQITWVGRILTNDYIKEFSKHDIHIKIKEKETPIPFATYFKQHYPYYTVETYYIKRIYSL